MKLTPIALLCSLMLLTACSSSGESPDSTPETPPIASTGAGSIVVGVDPMPLVETLPDVEFDGGSGGTSIDGEIVASESDTSPASIDDSTTASDAFDGASDGGATGDADIATTGSDAAIETVDSVSSPDASVIAPITEPFPDQFQAGTLTAADYDDQLNPHLYQSYASDYLQRVGGQLDIPYMDLSNRIALHVTDSLGNNAAGASITISGNNGDIISLTTPASGRTHIYSDMDELPDQLNIRATSKFGMQVSETISLSDAQSSGIIDIVLPEEPNQLLTDQETNALDIMFVVDTTGSMGDELNYLQTELTSIINAIPNNENSLNLGLTFYRDIGDEYVVRAHGFTNDITTAQQTLNNESFGGGGDYPEAMDQALHQAIDANWQPGSTRILFLIADAPPHAHNMRATWNAAEQARLKNIHIVPVAASGVAEEAEYIMRSMAALTNSRYLFLTDDSGFGNPHAEPDVDCYVVTHLDNLMIRVIKSLTTGQRDEPSPNDIIRQVGFYDNGVCDIAQTNQ